LTFVPSGMRTQAVAVRGCTGFMGFAVFMVMVSPCNSLWSEESLVEAPILCEWPRIEHEMSQHVVDGGTAELYK
jgi:hypothetical protein